MRLFLDTNVLIDFMGERPAFYAQAAMLFTLAVERKCEIVVSSVSMVTSNFICCERGNIPLSLWKGKANMMKALMEIFPVDSIDIYFACDSDWEDYEDCIQFSIAKRSCCDVIVTRNVRDFSRSDIPVMKPEDAIDVIVSNP